jgi:NTE family protein
MITVAALLNPCACLATYLFTGHEAWLCKGDLVEMLRASFSLPGLFSPVEVDGRWLVDGALVNPLPISVCRAMGAHVVIAVNLNADPIGRVRMPGQRIPRAAGFDILQALPVGKASLGVGSWLRSVFGREPDAPSLFGTMTQSLNILLDRVTRSRLAGEPPAVSISTRLGHIRTLEFDRAAEVIAEGEAATERTLAELGGGHRPHEQFRRCRLPLSRQPALYPAPWRRESRLPTRPPASRIMVAAKARAKGMARLSGLAS